MGGFVAEQARREARLFDELGASPLVEITGVVSPNGAGGARLAGADRWTLRAWLDAWRIGSGAIRGERVTLLRKVTDKELQVFKAAMRPESIVRLRVRLAEENSFGSPQALIEELIESEAHDLELSERLAQLRMPVKHRDGIFGELAFDRGFGWYAATTEWGGGSVELQLSATNPGELHAALQVAHALWADQAAWDERVRDFAVQELLPVKNDGWLDDDEAPLSPEGFKSRMALETIAVDRDGGFSFWYNDGDLFWGHAILVRGGLSEGPTDADIAG